MPKKLARAKKFFTKDSSKKTKIYKKAPPKKRIPVVAVQIPVTENIQSSSFIKKVNALFYRYKILLWVQIVFVIGIISGIAILYGLYQKIEKYSMISFSIDSSVKPYPLLSDTPNAQLSSSAYAVYEKDSRVFVIAKNENLRFPPASTAKMMTALIALETYPLDKVLKATELKTVEGSKMGLFDDEQIPVENLLYGLMLPSGNDAAYILAKNYPGGRDAFVAKMNEKASEFSLVNTHFIDPSGYEDENYSSARDLVRLAAIAEENPEFRKIVSTQRKIVYDISGTIAHDLGNLNELLQIPGVTGVKTGFTDEAKGVLVTSYVQNGKTYFISVLHSDDRFYDSRQILSEVIGKIQLLSF